MRQTNNAASAAGQTLDVVRARASAARVSRGDLERVYREVLSQCVSGVLGLIPKFGSATGRLGRALVWVQLGGLLLIPVALIPCVRPLFVQPPPEHAVIERWIETEHPGRIHVTKWHPVQANPKGDGLVVRVEYRYRIPGHGKNIATSQWFVIDDNRVTSVNSEL